MPAAKTLHLSPSLYHRHVMDRCPPQLAYDGSDFKTWQRKLKQKVRQLLGSSPFPAVPLDVRTLWKRSHPLGSIEKIVFTAEPRCDVTGYLCLPEKAAPPYTLFICLQGHSTGMHNSIAVDFETNEHPIQVAGDRDFGIGCMQRGIAALCLEQRSFGERAERVMKRRAPVNCHDAAMHALMLGQTLIGQRVHDVNRAIDYLAQRGDINMKKLGVMGNSGGGTTSLFAAAMLDRIQVAMPSCYFCTFRESIMAMHHCMCNYVPGLLNAAEMADVLGLFAPKPVVIVAGKTDDIFPLKAVRASFKHLQRIYAAAGAAANCRLVVGPEGHRFYADLAWPKMMAYLR